MVVVKAVIIKNKIFIENFYCAEILEILPVNKNLKDKFLLYYRRKLCAFFN